MALVRAEEAAFVRAHLPHMLEVAVRVRMTVSGPDEAALKVCEHEDRSSSL